MRKVSLNLRTKGKRSRENRKFGWARDNFFGRPEDAGQWINRGASEGGLGGD